jgi:NADPH:quinone reductase-like Zn-dependent oxidoreductase
MKQIWVTKAGNPERLSIRETPDPLPKNGEVRIRVERVGINFADILGRMGMYPDAPPIPYVPGYEIAGIVDKVGQGVSRIVEGDPVFAMSRFGGYADVVCVPEIQVFKRLEWMSVDHAAALPVNYLTAYMMLIEMGSLKANDKVLIHGAAGGVGLAAIDICRIVGAEMYGTASPQKHDFIKERGLHHPIDYRRFDYERVVSDTTKKHGVSLILDPLGGENWRKNYRLLMPTGRMVVFGASSIAPNKRRSLWHIVKGMWRVPRYSPLQLMNDNKGVLGVNIGHMWENAGMLQPWMNQIIDWYDQALFRPHIDRVFPFTQAPEAHHYIQDRQNIGKVLLQP